MSNQDHSLHAAAVGLSGSRLKDVLPLGQRGMATLVHPVAQRFADPRSQSLADPQDEVLLAKPKLSQPWVHLVDVAPLLPGSWVTSARQYGNRMC